MPEYRGIGAGELLQSWLPDARYIRLTRRDKVRQAVSHLKAIQSNAWWEMTTWTRTQQTLPATQPTFDADGIESSLLADKALVILAHHPQAQHSPWLGLGFPGVLLDPLLGDLPAFQGWPHLALPWGSPDDWDRFWMPLVARALPPPDPHGRVFHRRAQQEPRTAPGSLRCKA